MPLEFWLLAAHATVVVTIAVCAPRRQSDAQFTIGARRVNTLGITTAIFSTLVTESFIFFSVSLTALYGPVGGMVVVLGPCAALLLLSFVAHHTHLQGAERGLLCVSEYCTWRWGAYVGRFARLVLLLLLAWVVVLQINLNGRLVSSILGWPLLPATAWPVLLVLFYLFVGGYWTVIRTDIFQTVVLGTMLFVPLLLTRPPSLARAMALRVPLLEIGLIFGMSFALTLIRPELWQRVYSAASGAVAARALRLAALLFLGFGALVFYYSLAVVQAVPELAPTEAFVRGYQAVLPYPFAAFFPVLLLAAMMSSLDSAAFLFGASLTKEAERLQHRQTFWTRAFVVLVLVGGGALSLTIFDSLVFAYKLNGIVAVLAAPLILSYRFVLTPRQVGIAVAAGLAIYSVQIALGRIDKNPSEAFASALVAGAVLLVWLMASRVSRGWLPAPSTTVPAGP